MLRKILAFNVFFFVALASARADVVCSDGVERPHCDSDLPRVSCKGGDYTIYALPLQGALRVGSGLSGKKANPGGAGDLSFIFVAPNITRVLLSGAFDTGSSLRVPGAYVGGNLNADLWHNFNNDECSHFWWGLGLDAGGFYDPNSVDLGTNFHSGLHVFLGYFNPANGSCSFQLISAAGLGFFDNRLVGGRNWLFPEVGGKTVYLCKDGADIVNLSAEVSYDQALNFYGADTSFWKADVAKNFNVRIPQLGVIRLGLFGKTEMETQSQAWLSWPDARFQLIGGVQAVFGKPRRQ